MKFYLRGRLHAIICDDRQHPISHTTVRLYVQEKEGSSLISAPAKEAFQMLEEKQVKAKQKRLLAETTTDAVGNYTFEIDGDKQKYKGEALEFDLYYPDVPDYGQEDREKPKNFTPFQVTLDVLQPRWRETNDGLFAQWNHRASRKWWCTILKRLDIWVICGTLRDCKSQQPQAGIEVIAMDDDVISDDTLASAITDAQGRFCIYYRSKDFKKTFLSPFINVETPVFPLGNGPDIYFKFALGGSVFYEEDSSEARKPGRENVDNCLCVRLCIEGSKGEPISSFFHIGESRRYHAILNINPADGRTANKMETGWNELAFYGTLALLGTLEKTLNGQPMEYMFQYTELANPGDPIPSNESAWTDVLKTDIGDGTIIGLTPKFVSIPNYPFFYYDPDIYAINAKAGQIDVNFNGNWIIVPQAAQSLTGRLLNLISNKLAVGAVNMASLVPGNSTTTVVAPLQKNRYFSLRMKKRQAGNISSEVLAGTSRPIAVFNTLYQNVPQGGSWAPGAVSTELGVASLDLKELESEGGCSKITDAISVAYTAANPNLGDVSLTFSGPGATNNFEPIVFPSPGEEAHGTAKYIGNFGDLKNCAYEIRLSVGLRLTNGEQTHHHIWDRVLFCR
ncbi:hypothetical protein PZB74_06070 [Porifericola rhodea]|uniref:hypothetical protein n=1 Tax=Porifericola rhodea TaxID=930972 RepID=UPI002666FAC7|nr:hypothetical protein [Porifericola rhodea]WKN32909.1 hypothetical protein PZB74_06070 [Porifericola rhodea]